MHLRRLFLISFFAVIGSLIQAAAKPNPEDQTVSGTVDSIDGVIGFLRVKNADGEMVELNLTPRTQATDAQKHSIEIDTLAPGATVTVHYNEMTSAVEKIDVQTPRQADSRPALPATTN